MIQKQSAWLERAINGLEVHRQMSEPDVLDHPDTGDLVEVVRGRECAIVADRDAAPVGEPRLRDALLCEGRLIRTESDAGRIHSIVLGSVHDETAPAAAYVEQALAGLETKLPADQIELRSLRDIERVFLRAEVRARINHPPAEPELVEVVSNVVMKVNRRGVAHWSVPGPELSRPLGEPRIG